MAEFDLQKRDVVGSWRIDKLLGSGGQAQVWGARYVKDKHSVPGALKICTDPAPKACVRFAKEIELLRSQDHPGIVKVRDSGDYRGSPFFVMERAATTLHDVALAKTTGTRLIGESRELLFRFLRQACVAVAHLHTQGIVHRDLKPHNVLLMLDPPEPMRAVVADLGIASVDADQGQLTATHESIGTPCFRAPEALTGHHTVRSDVYSLGKTIEAVINRTATLGIGPGKCMRDSTLADDLWDALDDVLGKACSFDPKERYATAQALVDDLPELVLGQVAGIGGRMSSSVVATSLTDTEKVALSEFIGNCPGPGERASLYEVQRKSRLSDYEFSLAVHRLEAMGFLKGDLESDINGDPYPVLGPTSEGVSWAHDNKSEMAAAIQGRAQDADYGDIPF